MKRRGFSFLLAGLIIFPTVPRDLFAQSEPLPKFDEVYELLRTNGSNLTEKELNRAAVKGLLGQLQSHVVLVTNASPGAAAETNSLSKFSAFDDAFAYLRVGKVESGLNSNLKSAYQKLSATNKLKGVVLDLRYASGTDYAAAAKAADLFIKSEQPLLQWGEESARSTTKTNAIAVPVAVLVNHQTSGAAEALAGILRDAQVGLIIGTNTAGQASVFKEFSLKTGQRLKIASAPVKLGDGKEISTKGLKPDIEIAVNAADEKAFFENPYRTSPKLLLSEINTNTSATNLTGNSETNSPRARLNEAELVRMQREGTKPDTNRPRRRLNEAELVRLQRQGLTPDSDFFDEPAELAGGKPFVADPALVRALDLLKGLAVVQKQAESRR